MQNPKKNQEDCKGEVYQVIRQRIAAFDSHVSRDTISACTSINCALYTGIIKFSFSVFFYKSIGVKTLTQRALLNEMKIISGIIVYQ
jgi:hypothetical protein